MACRPRPPLFAWRTLSRPPLAVTPWRECPRTCWARFRHWHEYSARRGERLLAWPRKLVLTSCMHLQRKYKAQSTRARAYIFIILSDSSGPSAREAKGPRVDERWAPIAIAKRHDYYRYEWFDYIPLQVFRLDIVSRFHASHFLNFLSNSGRSSIIC